MFKLVLIALVVFTSASSSSADSLYMYLDGKKEYRQVDTTQIMIKWAPFIGELDGSGYLSAYPNIRVDSIEPNKADDYYLHFLAGSYNFNEILSQLDADPNVLRTNRVLHAGIGLATYYGDQIVCRFNPEVAQAYIDSLFSANNMTVVKVSPYISNQYTISISPSSPIGTLAMANYLWELPTTMWSHPNCRGDYIELGYSVYDSLFHMKQWGTKKVVGYKGTTNYGAWELTTGSPSIRVAVIDRGFEPHEDFNINLWDPGYDYVENDTVPEPVIPEPAGVSDHHGMAVLGILAAAHNNPVNIGEQEGTFWQSTAGMAQGARVIRARIFDPFGSAVEVAKIAEAISFAKNGGADVINCSWGGTGVYDAIRDAVNDAVVNGRGGKGCIIVASAGNHNDYYFNLLYPARHDSVLSVGAIQSNDVIHWYSASGPNLDVVAPSTSLCNNQCYQDTTNSSYTVDREGDWGSNPKKLIGSCAPIQDLDYVCTFGGTSAAAPLVSGEVALLLALESNLTRVQVFDIIRKSAVKLDANPQLPGLQIDTVHYGQGRANAVRALSTVRRGDCNVTGNINVVDMTVIVSFLFYGGPAPFPDKYFGDADCSGSVNVADVNYLFQYLFNGGPAPQKPCTAFLLD